MPETYTKRELLKEARLTMLRSQPDEQIETIKRIDTYLATPSESAMEDAREAAVLRGLVRRMRIAGNMVRDAMPNSLAVRNWVDVCAEADKVLGD